MATARIMELKSCRRQQLSQLFILWLAFGAQLSEDEFCEQTTRMFVKHETNKLKSMAGERGRH
jgi:hypothetical protein